RVRDVGRLPPVRPLELAYLDLLHLKHGRHDPSGLCRIGVTEHPRQHVGNDLPREAVFVFEPAALLRAFVSTLRQFVPVVVDLFLRVATDLERDGRREAEYWPTIERGKWLPVELECDGEHRAGGSSVNFAPGLSISGDVQDLG